MSDFAPSVENVRSETRVTRGEYPPGMAGVQLSLEQIALRIREGSTDPAVMGWAMDQLKAAGVTGRGFTDSAFTKMGVLLDAVRSAIVYTPDPPMTEYVKSAATMLCLRPGLCVRGGDCDDHIILLGSLLMSVGIPVRIVKQTFGGNAQEHVLIEAQDDSGSWVALDPSTNMPPGRKAPAMSEVSIDPLDPRMAGLAGKPEAEFIGVGRVPRALHLPPRRVGVGAPTVTTTTPTPASDPYAQSYTDLRNQMQAVADAGDAYLKNGDPKGALSAYQAAGNAGAFNVGPEIDLAGAPLVTQSFTEQAWSTNQSLAATTDAYAAGVLVRHMIDLYVQAIAQGRVAQSPNTAGLPPPPTPTPNPSIGVTQVAPWVLGAGFLLGLAFMRER